MISETDLELLTAFLDDALSTAEVERVVTRLASDADLAETLRQMRADRSVRLAAWESFAPTEEAAQQFASRTIRSIRHEQLLETWRRWTRTAGTIAASVAIGLMVGWYAWGRSARPAGLAGVIGSGQTVRTAGQGGEGSGTYQVALTDDHGNVLAVEHFAARDEAERFAQDLGKVQERRQDVQDGHATLISDRF